MSDFASHRYFKPAETVPQMDENPGMLDHFGELNSSLFESFNVTDCSAGYFLGYHYQTPENPLVYSHNILGNSHSFHSKDCQVPMIDLTRVDSDENEKWKARQPSESISEDVCSAESANQPKGDNKNNKSKKNGLEKPKKRRYKRKQQDKPEEVIHVRAKRGQATDTHSLAERVRRERINNKLRFLQGLVPGCEKTMGLVTMLDEIISYVHSLKNQVEFLSMELEAACSYQLSRNKRATKNAQGTRSHEAQEIEKWVREQY